MTNLRPEIKKIGSIKKVGKAYQLGGWAFGLTPPNGVFYTMEELYTIAHPDL